MKKLTLSEWAAIGEIIGTVAYDRHNRQLLASEQSEAWDDYFVYQFSTGPETISYGAWQDLQYGYPRRFWNHVNGALFANEE